MTDRLGIDLLRDWDAHNRPHSCYYEQSEDGSYGECPATEATLGDFLESEGFPVKNLTGLFFGRKLSEPNFRSKKRDSENPVSIRERREAGTLAPSKAIQYEQQRDRTKSTEVLSSRARRAQDAAVENGDHEWVPDAMQYYKGRLDAIESKVDELLTAVTGLIGYVVAEPAKATAAGVEVVPSLTVTLENVDADIAEDLRAELLTRAQRLSKRKAESHRDWLDTP